jgi:uncharacterized protein YndB with AHSA1/START domain
MPIVDITSNPEDLTLTITGEYEVPVDQLWQAWADPRQIERFWGPPTWPATFTRHDMVAGGRSEYFMTGPDGTRSAGYWVFESVDAGRGFVIVDGFANEDGTANDDLPGTRTEFRFESTDSGSRYVAATTFGDLASMEQLVEMGMVEGVRLAQGQLDDILADLASFAVGRAAEPQLLDDTRVRVSRVIRGTVSQVWLAHHDPDLVSLWLLGPDGWTMPVCVVATHVGDRYRYEWESGDGENRFGFEGELLESAPPHRSVTTERMIGTDAPVTRNEMTLTAFDGGTLVAIVITYPTTELRDQILGMGMVDGMETSYARLETVLESAAV